MINAFACNFKINGVINSDVVQASFLNARIYQRLAIKTLRDDLNDKPIIILSTEFDEGAYGKVLDGFKARMGLSGAGNLMVLSNVSMWVQFMPMYPVIIDLSDTLLPILLGYI